MANFTGDENGNILVGGEGDDTLNGNGGNDSLLGGSGNDQLNGGEGDDILVGGAGADTIDGGNGTDTVDYSHETGASGVSVNLGPDGMVANGYPGVPGPSQASDTFGEIDTLISIERVITGAGSDAVVGSTASEYFETRAGDDYLSGGGGTDTFVGGSGDDHYIVEGTATVHNNGGISFGEVDQVVEQAGDGVDNVTANVTYTLGANVENLQLIGDLDLAGFGNSLNNVIIGNAGDNFLRGLEGDDYLNGGEGADFLDGATGNDTYVIDHVNDIVAMESPDALGGIDTVISSIGYTLGFTLENLTLTGTAAINGTGNHHDNIIIGNNAANVLIGGAGNDHLIGGDGDDLHDGGFGGDTMAGGDGNDRYLVDHVGDVVIEAAGFGDDMVIARFHHNLAAGASVETMTTVNASATTAINLTGNELNQSLYGNAGNNILTGLGGADYLVGGLGNDKYYVDELDFIAESVGGGDDWVFVPGTYVLRDGVEVETLVAVDQNSLDPVNLTGNEFGQSLYGSQGANSLNGGLGNDYLVGLGGNDFLLGGGGNDNLAGGQGNDLYYVDAGDAIVETAGEGDDLAVALQSFALGSGQSVETLAAAEGTAGINLTGNALAQSLYGNAGNNVLTSGGGADYLVGGAGSDTFVLTNAPGVSTIADYAAGEVVDIAQYLSVGSGTNIVSGGYVRIVGTELQVDGSGGGDSWVTVGNVSGSGAVTIRYQSGGAPTDVSISRSASQEAAASSKLAPRAEALGTAAEAASLSWEGFADVGQPDALSFEPFAPQLDPYGII